MYYNVYSFSTQNKPTNWEKYLVCILLIILTRIALLYQVYTDLVYMVM